MKSPRILSTIVILFIALICFVQLTAPLSAQAAVPTWDIGLNPKEYGLDMIVWEIARIILHAFAQAIINWIRTGQDPFFTGGTNGSLFVTNITNYLESAANNAAGLLLEDYFGPSFDSLCSPFRIQVGLGLDTTYRSGNNTFKYQAKCTITGIVANLENFYSNFENGGWQAWFSSARYENNPYGLRTLADNYVRVNQGISVHANLSEFLAGLGFPGLKKCNDAQPKASQGQVAATNDTNGYCNSYTILSPGKAIESQLTDAFG